MEAAKFFDQSYIVVRGKDGKIRGFVNACRHRGNALCQAANGQSGRFTCPYHLWTYGLDGKLLAVARPHLVGKLDKADHGLVEVLIDTFAGFIFLNPDRGARSLPASLGAEVMERLSRYNSKR